MEEASEKLRYELKNVRPVTAEMYAQGLMSIADEYEQYMALHLSKAEHGTAKMMVSSVRNGSIISDIQPFIAGTLPLIEALKHVKDYASYLKAVIDWTLGLGSRPEIVDERKTLKNISNIVKPSVHDQGSQVNIGTITVHGDVNFNVSVTEEQARHIVGFARARTESEREVKPGDVYENVVLYWDQTSRRLNAKIGDKGKIDSISDASVRVNFADEETKKQMVLTNENPYHHAYLVDVTVQTAAGRIVLYTVTRLIEVIDMGVDS